LIALKNCLTFLIALKRLDYRVAILGFPRGSVTPLAGIVIDWFTPASHPKDAEIMTGNLNKEL
jgi:hypothetical protein